MQNHIPLARAAEKLKTTIEELIHLGATQSLTIYVTPKSEWEFNVLTVARLPKNIAYESLELKDFSDLFKKNKSNELCATDKSDDTILASQAKFTGQLLCCFDLCVPFFSLREYEAYKETAKLTYLSVVKENIQSIFEYSGDSPPHLKDCHLYIDELDVERLQQRKPKTAYTDETTAISKESLLKIIAGMAIKGYLYNPKNKKNSATKDIQADLDKLGISLSEDTIRNSLKAAMNYLPENT